MQRSLDNYGENNLAAYLSHKYGFFQVRRLLVGTSPKWDGAAILWQVDERFGVCAATLALYTDAGTLRQRLPLASLGGRYAVPELDGYTCFFGQHLLSKKIDGNYIKPIAIVENELTAIEQNILDRSRTWLAAGDVDALLQAGAFRSLFNNFCYKDFQLYPCGQKVDTWAQIAKRYRRGARITLADQLPR
jgi:hypothetical protein